MYKLFLFTCFLFTCNADAQMIQRTQVIMGTFASISLDKEQKALLRPSFKILQNVENSLSSYKATSPIFELNCEKQALLDNYAFEAVQLSLTYYKHTAGYFDIAIGRITKDLYRFGENEKLPLQKELRNSSTAINQLVLQGNKATLSGNIKVDLGGMGKGFGVDKVSEFLIKKRVKRAVIALSGDIRCIGKCKIAINNPLHVNAQLASFTMQNSGVSTSGNYNRYVKSRQYNHLINPKTKQSEQQFLSITLVSNLPSATLDAYATAASVMPMQKAYAFLNAQALGYIILQTDKQLVVSPNMTEYVTDLQLK